MKKLALLAFLLATPAFAGGVPQIPVSPNWNEPSQFVSTMNQWISQLNGAANSMFATQGVVSFGSFGTISGATPQTLNTARGVVTFTGVTIAGVATGNVVINNSLVTTASVCSASLVSDNSAAGSFPYIRSVVPTAGVLTIAISNAAAATTTGSSSFGVAFNCVN
jgi:hypothetical protein